MDGRNPSDLADSAGPETAGEESQLAVTQRVGNYLLASLDRACRELGIDYFIYAGTLLGAVRSGGWIPWDDDVDVVMFRGDYERFRLAASDVLPNDVAFSDMRTSAAHIRAIARLAHLGSTRFRPMRELSELPPDWQHICLDIFILDRAPAGSVLHRAWRGAIRTTEKLIVARATSVRAALSHRDSPLLKRMIEAAGVVAARLAPSRAWRRLHLRVCTFWSAQSWDVYSGTNHFKARFRQIRLSRSDFLPTRDLTFAGMSVKAPAAAERILALQYGSSFMTPPPESERVPLHVTDEVRIELEGRTWTFGLQHGE